MMNCREINRSMTTPVKCEVDIESLSTEAFSERDYEVMGHAFKCHNQLGRLADERVYEYDRRRTVPRYLVLT